MDWAGCVGLRTLLRDSATTYAASYNSNNQITQTPFSTPLYDAAGNITSLDNNQYLYDDEGRVCAVSGTPVLPGMPSMTQYIYDAEGRRVAKGTISSFTCDMATNGFSLTASYVLGQGGEQVTEMSGSGQWVHTNVFAGGQLLATYDPQGTHFQITDWLGSRRVQADYQGRMESRYQNLPFGEFVPTNTSPALGATEQHFTGKERDAESGNDFFGARYYGSSMGRFMSPDPYNAVLIKQNMEAGGLPAAAAESFFDGYLENPQNWNKYAYAFNNPLRFTDPTGAAAVDGHHLIPLRNGLNSPLARSFADSIKTGNFSGNGAPNQPGFNAAHRAYNDAAQQFLQEAEQSEGDCNNWSVSQWKDFANKLLNSDEPAIKNFLDELERNNQGAKAALAAAIATYKVPARIIAQAIAGVIAIDLTKFMTDIIIIVKPPPPPKDHRGEPI